MALAKLISSLKYFPTEKTIRDMNVHKSGIDGDVEALYVPVIVFV